MLLPSLIDAEFIGCSYNEPDATGQNTAALQRWIRSLEDQGASAGLAITGDEEDGRREPGTLFLDCSDGPAITNPEGTDASFMIAGLPGSELRGTSADDPATPVIHLKRDGSAILIVQTLRIISDGSGIRLDNGGANTVFRDLFIQAGGAGAQRLDDFADIDFTTVDSPIVLCSYGIWINNSDGGFLDNVRMIGCANHGLLATRWHDGHAHIGQIHSSGGIGFKGERVNGCNIDMRCESSFAWGMFLERSGGSGGAGSLTSKGVGTASNEIHVWFENNNQRVPNAKSRGYTNRQFKLRECSRCHLYGNTAWSKNLGDVRHSEELANDLADHEMSPPGDVEPALDLQQLELGDEPTPVNTNDFGTVWNDQVADFRPQALLEKGDDGHNQLVLRMRRNSYRKISKRMMAWCMPFGSDKVTARKGDLILWTAEVSIDEDGAHYAQSREPVEGAPNYPAWLGTILVNQHDTGILAPKTIRNAEKYIILWDTRRRKFTNHLFRQGEAAGGTNSLLVSVFFPGMDQGPNSDLPATDFVITLHDLKVYVIPA